MGLPLRIRAGGRLAALALTAALTVAAAGQEPETPDFPQPELPREPPQTLEEQGPPAQAGAVPETPAPGEETPPAAAPPPERRSPTFRLPVPPDRGGGFITGRADEFEYDTEAQHASLSGQVEIRYQDIEVEADLVEADLTTNTVHATGNVVLDQGPKRITADRAVFHLDTKLGEFENANAFVAPDYYFRGREVAKVGEEEYTVEDGVFTSCEGDSPAWSFRMARARVEVEAYAHVRHATMRIKRMPVLYTPYIVWPARTERTSGLLIPEIGYSDRRGTELGLAYYRVLGRSYDTTFHVDTYSEGFLGLGNELRYRPSEGTWGDLVAYAIRDPDAVDQPGLDEWRWKVDWEHVTRDLPFGMRGVVSFHDFSDFQFFRDFERDFDSATIRSLESRGFVSGDWGPHSLNVVVEDRETFFGLGADPDSERIISQSKLPEMEYRLRPTRLGGLPLYLEALSSLSYLSVDRQRNYNDSYGRVDLFPQLRVPLAPVPWLSLSVSAGGRMTWYSDSIYSTEEIPTLPPEVQEEVENRSRFRGESLTRMVPFAGAEIVGPSFSRIFDAEVGPFARFKHVVEPRFTVSYLGDFDEAGRVPNFDEVDNLRRTVSSFGLGSTQSTRWSLVNRLLGKPADEAGGSAREILSFEIAQEVSLDDDQPLQLSQVTGERANEGPLSTLLRFSPSLETNLKAQVDYSGFFSNLVGTSLSGSHRVGRGSVAATWFTRYDAETGDTRADQVRFYGGFQVLPQRLRFDTQVNYDLVESLLQQQTYVASWNAQCYAVRLEMRDFRAGNRRDTEYYFTLSLKNVGTFLPLTARQSTMLP